LILEGRDGRIVGIEVKMSHTVNASNFKALRTLQSMLGDRFARGIVLHTGTSTVSFGERLHAMPVSAIWS
jgi:hypothetical protein